MPKRLLKRRYLPVAVVAAAILASFLISAWAFHSRSSSLDEILYKQCVSNEQQDAVIVSLLNAIPQKQRTQLVNDAINALEPPDEPPCTPPKGAFP